MKIQKEKILAATLTALLFISLIGSLVLFRNNSILNDGLNDEKLRTGSLMEEKVTLTKEIDKLKKDYANLLNNNKEYEKRIAELNGKLQEKDQRIAQLYKDSQTMKGLRTEVAELQQLRSALESQVSALLAENSKLKEGMEDLEDHYLALQIENSTLSQEIEKMKLAAVDKTLIQSLKGNKKDRLTLNSNKVKKLSVSFDLPGNSTADLKFQVLTPSGKKINEPSQELSWYIPGDLKNMTASLDGASGEIEVTKRVEMTYAPAGKMEKGIYTIAVYNGKTYAGSCQIRLK